MCAVRLSSETAEELIHFTSHQCVSFHCLSLFLLHLPKKMTDHPVNPSSTPLDVNNNLFLVCSVQFQKLHLGIMHGHMCVI